jgi:hypothetical protein
MSNLPAAQMARRKLFIGGQIITQINIAKDRIRNQSGGKFTTGKYEAFYHFHLLFHIIGFSKSPLRQ